MITSFFYGLILEARADIQKCFRSFFGSNENFNICFRDLLTFKGTKDAKYIAHFLICKKSY